METRYSLSRRSIFQIGSHAVEGQCASTRQTLAHCRKETITPVKKTKDCILPATDAVHATGFQITIEVTAPLEFQVTVLSLECVALVR